MNSGPRAKRGCELFVELLQFVCADVADRNEAQALIAPALRIEALHHLAACGDVARAGGGRNE